MKKLSLGVAALFASVGLHGQGFVLQGGSDGSDGALEVSENQTLSLPPDGIFNYTTITISESATLRFERNALNTPVYLLATGDVDISGTFDVRGSFGSGLVGGKGGPGGFDGGRPGFTSDSPPGAGFGPGAGKGGLKDDRHTDGAGSGAFRTRPIQTSVAELGRSTNHGDIYGNALLRPLIEGSGGGGATGSPGVGGGGGGGGLLVGSSTKIIVNGKVLAGGGRSVETDNVDNSGSGGAIRLVAPAVEGSGQLSAIGGNNDSGSRESGSNLGGHGRIRIDAFEISGATGMTFEPTASLSAGSSVFVFPKSRPSLDIVSAAGNDIAPGTQGPVRLNLPFNASTTQNVRLRAANFGGVVPVSVVVTPAHGDPTEFQAEIDNAANNPAEVDISVEVPTNVQVTLQVWTR
jgi:hypothetical protein